MLGRRPYNDIVIDNLAVSGEHVAFHMNERGVEAEDLGSTNGTYVNSKAVKRQELRNGDTVEVGKYKIRFLNEDETNGFENHAFQARHGAATGAAAPCGSARLHGGVCNGRDRVLSGAAAGREVALTKVVTTIGKPGVAVASITRRHQGFVLAHVEGPTTHAQRCTHRQCPVPLHAGDKPRVGRYRNAVHAELTAPGSSARHCHAQPRFGSQ